MQHGQKPTTHEMLSLNETIRVEATETQKLAAMLPMIGDEELRQELTACLQTGRAHLKALVDFSKAHQLAH